MSSPDRPLDSGRRVIVPRWLTARDWPWLRQLIEEFEAHVGTPRRALAARLEGSPAGRHDPAARRLAVAQLDRAFRRRIAAAVPPRLVRARVFRAAAAAADAEAALSAAARELGLAQDAVRVALLADLPAERHLEAPEAAIEPARLALRCNLALAQGWLRKSRGVELELLGQARAVVRHAKLRGLLCTVERLEDDAGHLTISGPFALFRHTALYGRALAELLPLLAWARRFSLRAECEAFGQPALLLLDGRDPIEPAAEPRRYDSKLEERLARDLRRLAPDWEVIREPAPVAAAGTLIFPDFALQHRHEPERRFLLELVGFWTAGYVQRKLARLRAASLDNLILCLDAARDCGQEELPAQARVVRYARRPDAAAIARILTAPRPA